MTATEGHHRNDVPTRLDAARMSDPDDLHVSEQGEGPPVVLIHGFGANAFTWAKIRVMLSLRNTVFALDLKGFGDSPKPDDGAYSLRDHAENVLRFIEGRRLTDVALVGHSFGGGVALVAALELQRRAPGRLRRLVLIGSMGAPQRIPPELQALRTPILGELLVAASPLWLVRGALLASYYDPRRIEDVYVEAYTAPLRARAARRALLHTLRQTTLGDLQALIARCRELSAPVVLLWGRQDRIVPLAAAERLQAAIPGARLIVLEQCGHNPQEEFAEGTLAVLREVL
jgi:pimeloyl-ACP methyl ester carboxylesterase